MPIPLIAELAVKGVDSVPWVLPILKTLPWIIVIWLLKAYFGGARNHSERLMRSKVVIVTGGTSGIGASVVLDLAHRGAQVIILTQHSLTDAFLVDYLDDLREATKNQYIYAEQVDLASLHAIRTFATKWINNVPPRRLDAIVLCADSFTPRFGVTERTVDDLEPTWAINYLANFQLLNILSPALRNQPPDREVRIVYATCASYVGGHATFASKDSATQSSRPYETSKLASLVYAQALQKRFDAYNRSDKRPNNVHVVTVDPGYCRTPGMRRWITMGTLWGLLGYMITLPFWWLVLKSASQGSQGFLAALMDPSYGRAPGGRHLKECREIKLQRAEIEDEKLQQALWSVSEAQILEAEKNSAIRRAKDKGSTSKETAET